MKAITKLMMCLLLASCWTGTVFGNEFPEIDGVFGLNEITDATYLAVWVPVQEGAVVTGVQWYQSDGSTVYPEILAEAGLLDWPSPLTEAVLLAEDVGGSTLAWSEVTFPQPITADSAGLYIFFRLPEGTEFQHNGTGGGFGLGHYEGNGIRSCWLTINGEDWHPMDAGHRMAVEPIIAPDKAAGEVLVLKLHEPGNIQQEQVKPVPEASLVAYPNPFNPQTEIKFVVPKAGHVQLGVYDLRGRRIAGLVGQHMASGEHSTVWTGRNQNGRKVASGVYFARLEIGAAVLTKQLVLLK